MTEPLSSFDVKQKQQRLLAVVLGVLALLAGALYLLLDKESTARAPSEAAARDAFASALPHVNTASVWNERLENKVTEAFKRQEEAQAKLAETRERQAQDHETSRQALQTLQQQLASVQAELGALKAVQAEVEEKALKGVNSPRGDGGIDAPPLFASSSADRGIRQDTLSLTVKEEAMLPARRVDNYVPSGTFAEAIVLGGADASAAVGSQGNPKPMQFQIRDNGTLPNHYQGHLKGCIVTAAVAGDISSERGEIRLETLSCVREDKSILDIPVQGTVYDGQDGKNAMWGRPVWREGAMVQRATAAGLFSGFADALSQTYTTSSISPLGSTETVNTNAIMQYGLAKGAGNGMNKLSDYYIARAEQYHPVIQLPPGGKVTIAFTKGFFLMDEEERSREKEKESLPTSKKPRLSTHHASSSLSGAAVSTRNDQAPALTLTPQQVARLQAHQAELGFMTSNLSPENTHETP